MSIHVELTEDAANDLEELAKSGLLKLFLSKLVKLEEDGPDIARPLGRDLTNWKKIVVGDRQWRIVFITDPKETVATVWVMGDRSDEECYAEALSRIAIAKNQTPQTQSLAAVLAAILMKKGAKKSKKGKK